MSETVPSTPHPAFPKRMSWEEFQKRGYLQEVNRRFFHPLGLAMALGRETAGGPYLDHLTVVWDGRDDPEGYVFEELAPSDVTRGMAIEADFQRLLALRTERLGFGVQPLVTEAHE